MNDIITSGQTMLPETIEDLTQFVLVGKAKLQAYMLKLQTVNKLSVAQEIRDQTLKEAQEVSNAVIAAEQRIGELLLAIPKQAGASNFSRDEEKLKTKGETIKEMGYGKNEASDYQQMAKHPEVVQKVLTDALANGEIVTKASVMREIKFYKERIAALEDRKPERVVPDDYVTLKKKAKQASAWESDYNKQRDKVIEKQREIEKLQDKIKTLQKQTVLEQNNNDLTASAIMFAMQCRNFIESVGGYVFLSAHLKDLPEREREGYKTAAQAVHDWAHVLLDNIRRENTNEEG